MCIPLKKNDMLIIYNGMCGHLCRIWINVVAHHQSEQVFEKAKIPKKWLVSYCMGFIIFDPTDSIQQAFDVVEVAKSILVAHPEFLRASKALP